MSESKLKNHIPENFESLEQASDFWDTHSVADYWDDMTEVEVEVRAARRHQVTVEPDLWEKVASTARAKGISVETLVNLWLAERVAS